MNKYIISPALERAVEIALFLGKPLLLCGEPGTGKSTLANALAQKFAESPPNGLMPFYPEPLKFYTKTTSAASDLFYTYDGLARLRDAYAQQNTSAPNYIELKALGKAIILKHGAASKQLDNIRTLKNFRQADENTYQTFPAMPTSSIVLVDEIDKAPRDFPNDILNEIENFHFEIKEMDVLVPSVENNAQILVIMTSNNEKNLPDAFLRRCVFHYIDFPSEAMLSEILGVHFPDSLSQAPVSKLIDKFYKLRSMPLTKRPATAEFISWIQYLNKENLLKEAQEPFSAASEEVGTKLKSSLGILVKNEDDLTRAKEEFEIM